MDVKKIALYIFISIISISIIYFIFLRPNSSSTNINKNGNNCSHCDLDKNTCDPIIGKCIPKDLCNGKEKPDNACNYVCFKNEKWVCDTYPCLNSYLPDYIDCTIDELKCDNNNLYCQGVTGCNEGNRYYYSASKTSSCICPLNFKGPECEFSNEKTCNSKGNVNDNGECTCYQPYYGDNCQNKCGPTGSPTGMYVYDNDNKKCICGPSYESKGEICNLRNCNGHGNLNKDKCTCDGGWTGPNCETSICNQNQVYDSKTKSCICKTDDTSISPYNRYYGPECILYHCNLKSEYKDNGTCDCSKDSCGKYCQYTRSNICNGNGKPSCNDNGIFTSCVCDNGWTGTNCNCEISKKPVTDDDKCKGISTICGPTGWQPYYSNCQELYNSYKDQNEWSKSCIDQLYNDKFYKQIYKDNSTYTIGTLSCEDSTINKNGTSYICTDTICLHGQGCSKQITDCSDGKVNICDSTTKYNWECKDQLSGDCDSTSIGNVCKSGNPPTCFHCGTLSTSELVCMLDGGTPSKDCMGGLGIEKVTPTNHNGIYIDKNNYGLPIYPTTLKKECSNLFLNKSNTNPYSIQQNIDPTIYSNPVASYDDNSNTLTDLTNSNNRFFYPDLENGKNARCILDQTDLITYLSNGKKDSTLCSSNGDFIQNDKLILDSNNNNSPGYCKCKEKYAGKNCEFSSYNTCNSNGNPNYDGKLCVCYPGFNGKNCEFSDSKTCNSNGNVDYNGNCKCNPGFTGKNCEFLTGYYCHEDGKCKEGSLHINEKNSSFFNNQNSCNSTCIPKNKSFPPISTYTEDTDTVLFGCNFGNNASKARDACNRKVSDINNTYPGYSFYCNPAFDGSEVMHDNSTCNIWCNCSGTAINNKIYQETAGNN